MSARFFSDAEIKRLRSWPEELGARRADPTFHARLRRSGPAGERGVRDGEPARGWRSSCARCRGWVPCPTTSPRCPRPRRTGSRCSWAFRSLIWRGTGRGSRPAPSTCGRSPPGWGGVLQGRTEWKDLEEFLLARAIDHDAPSVLFRLGRVAELGAARPGLGPRVRPPDAGKSRVHPHTLRHLRRSAPAQRPPPRHRGCARPGAPPLDRPDPSGLTNGPVSAASPIRNPPPRRQFW